MIDNRYDLPKDNDLPIHLLAAIFNDKNQSYKLFWFSSLLDLVCVGRDVATYDELINRMISKAWYMVKEYHLNLGPADALEQVIYEIKDTSGLKSSENTQTIVEYLNQCKEKPVINVKKRVSRFVPYRLQAPFIGPFSEKEWANYDLISEKAQENEDVLYRYERTLDNKRQVRMNEKWIPYLRRNEAIVRGWVKLNLIEYLQRRNPSVPGIPFKLEAPEKRDLKVATEFWKAIIVHENFEIKDIYSGIEFSQENVETWGRVSIDHFIPWSYTASDEMWNLTPTFARINSSKSNFLPQEKDMELLVHQHFLAYQVAQENSEIKKIFEKLKKNNLNSEQAEQKIYRPSISERLFCENMKDMLLPLYLSAKNMGFENWTARNFQ